MHHISKFMAVDPEFVKKLIDSFYVDDFVGAEPRRVKLSICIVKLSTGWQTGDSSLENG